jgi:hypothetical protein
MVVSKATSINEALLGLHNNLFAKAILFRQVGGDASQLVDSAYKITTAVGAAI